jgi:methionyl-tRNA synthetase
MPRRAIVTSALPYANGPIHFGHVVGAYLPADIYVRYRRLCGDDVHFVCGTDEHGVAITLKAEQAGQPYEAYVDHWHGEIARSLASMGIEFDVFSGTAHHRNPFHRPLSQQFFTDLLNNGYLKRRTEKQFYNPRMDRFLPDRYVQGQCYVCGFERARGDECPKCGSWLDAKRLGHPICTLDGSTPVLRDSDHWYLDLPKVRAEWLQRWFEGHAARFKPNVRNFVAEAMKDLPERPITRDLPWGVPVPLPDAAGKVLYVWFDAPIGYLSISQQHFARLGRPEEFERWWKGADTELYHFIGKDNITFHVLTFPAMLWGTRRGWIVPTNVPANEFFNLEGRKFNTSAGWFVSEDSIRGKFPVDALRYSLTTMMPESADAEWSWRDFQARVNGELADNLGNFVSRVFRFVEQFCGGALQPFRPERATAADDAILAAGSAAARDMGQALAAFQFRAACSRLMAFGGECNKYFDEQKPWATRKSDEARCHDTLRVCAELIRTLAILSQPIMPATARAVLAAVGSPPAAWADAGGLGLSPDRLPLSPLPVLFPKVDDDYVEREATRLRELAKRMDQAGTAGAAGPAAPPASGDVKPAIDIDAFAAVDLRIGTIVKAEKHPQADKLLVLHVDLGFEVRTVVAGVAAAYGADEVVGRQVVVVANLAPRKIRGIESRGMILAANDGEGKPRFLAPERTTDNGVPVK